MDNFIIWLFNNFYIFISTLSARTLQFINDIAEATTQEPLYSININLTLFSDTAIYSGDLFVLLGTFFSIFYSMIFVVIVWKIIKKVIVKITRWNKW